MFVEEYMADVRRAGYRPSAWVTYFRRWFARSRAAAFERPQTLRSLGITGLLGVLFLLAAGIVLSFTTTLRVALEFFNGTVFLLMAGLLGIASDVRRLVDSNGRPLARINAANLFTLARLVSIPAILVFVNHGYVTLGLATFLVGASTDVIDGWLARHMNDATPLGRVFDPIVDILFNASVFVALAQAGYVPAWVLALVLLRYGLLLFGAALIYIFRGPVEIKPTVLGKATGVITTGLLLALVGSALWLSAEAHRQVAALLVMAIGFVEAITIPQVIGVGIYNFKRAGQRAQAVRLRVVAGERAGEAPGRPDRRGDSA
jgi:cardiolipin synthase